MLTEAPEQQFKLLRLRGMNALVNRIKNLGGLVNQGQRGPDRRVCPALAHLQFRRAANPLRSLLNGGQKLHHGRAGFLVGKRHDGVLKRHAIGLDQRTATGGDAEDIGILPGAGVRHEEAGKIGKHARVQHFAGQGGGGIGQVAHDVQQADIIEAKAGHERIFHEVHARFGHFVILVIVADDRKNFLRRNVNRDDVGHLQAGNLALVLMFEAGQVQLAIALVNLPVVVLKRYGFRGDALLGVFSLFDRIRVRGLCRRQGNVAVDFQDLQPLDRGRLHHHAVGDAASVAQIGGGGINDQIVGIDALGDGPLAQRAVIDFLERGSKQAQLEKHLVGVGIVFRRRDGQIMIHVLLQGIGHQVTLDRRTVCGIIPDFQGAIDGQKLAPAIGLKPQIGLQQKGRTNAGHALDGGAVCAALCAGRFDCEAQQLDAFGAGFHPVGAGGLVVLDAAYQVAGHSGQELAVYVIDQIAKPPLVLSGVLAGFHDGLVVHGNHDGAIVINHRGSVAFGAGCWVGNLDVHILPRLRLVRPDKA